MTTLFTLLFYLYVTIIILGVITMLFFTPVLVDKIAWLRHQSSENKVLYTLPLHAILIVMAVVSIWNIQTIKSDYEIRSGNAKIEQKYERFFEDQHPKLGKAYQQVMLDIYTLESYLNETSTIGHHLHNQQNFLFDIQRRWAMILDRLKSLKRTMETSSQARAQSSLQTASRIAIDFNQTYSSINTSKAHIYGLMQQHARKSARFLLNPQLSGKHERIDPKNYHKVIRYFLVEHGDLERSLSTITTAVSESRNTVTGLSDALNYRRVAYQRDALFDAKEEWQKNHDYAYHRLFRILYALETEYVLRKLKLPENERHMIRLTTAIRSSVPRYADETAYRWKLVKRDSNPQTVLALQR